MGDNLDDEQEALLADMHALSLRWGTEAVAIVIESYHRNVGVLRDTQQLLISSRRLAGTRSGGSLLGSTPSGEIASEDRTVATQLKSDSNVQTPTRRKGKIPAKLSTSSSLPSQSSQHSPHPPTRPTHTPPQPPQHPPRRSKRGVNTPPQPPQSSHSVNPLVLPTRRKPLPDANTRPRSVSPPLSLLSDSPTLSSVSDSPTLSPALDLPPPAQGPGSYSQIFNLTELAHHVKLDVTPAGLTPTIRQDMATGPQDEWFCVIRGRRVGIFNNQASVGDSIRGVKDSIHYSATSQHDAFRIFVTKLVAGLVTISYRES